MGGARGWQWVGNGSAMGRQCVGHGWQWVGNWLTMGTEMDCHRLSAGCKLSPKVPAVAAPPRAADAHWRDAKSGDGRRPWFGNGLAMSWQCVGNWLAMGWQWPGNWLTMGAQMDCHRFSAGCRLSTKVPAVALPATGGINGRLPVCDWQQVGSSLWAVGSGWGNHSSESDGQVGRWLAKAMDGDVAVTGMAA